METNKIFKCCKNKEFNNYCCKVCYGIFHESCLTRKKSVVVVGGHVILCSKECKEIDTTHINDIKILEESLENAKKENSIKERTFEEISKKYDIDMEEMRKCIEDLSKEIREKDSYIKRLKRNTQDFEDQVFEQEQNMNLQIKEQRDLISGLIREKNELFHINEDLKVKLEENTEQQKIIENQLEEFNNIKKDMISTIQTLTADNDTYASEVLQLRNKLYGESRYNTDVQTESSDAKMDQEKNRKSKSGFETIQHVGRERQDKDYMQTHTNAGVTKGNLTTDNTTDNDNIFKKTRRLMILSDEYGRYLDYFIKRKDRTVQTETIIKPGASMGNVIADIVDLTKGYTLDDYVVIIAGSNDFRLKKHINFREINSKIRFCTNTNIIFTSVPSIYFSQNQRKLINEFNSKIADYACRLDRYAEGSIKWIDLCTKNGRIIKNIAANKISTAMNSPVKNVKNIKFVNVNNERLSMEQHDHRQDGDAEIHNFFFHYKSKPRKRGNNHHQRYTKNRKIYGETQ